MKTIKTTISTLAIVLISLKSISQEKDLEVRKETQADSLSFGLFNPSTGKYENMPYGEDNSRFIFIGDTLYTTGNLFYSCEQEWIRGEKLVLNARRLIDKDGNECILMVYAFTEDSFMVIEFRYPSYSLRYKINDKNEQESESTSQDELLSKN